MEDTLNICENCQDIFQSAGEAYCPGCERSLEMDQPEIDWEEAHNDL